MRNDHRPVRVFISGPMESHGNVAANVGRAMKAAVELRRGGFDFCLPHLNWYVQTVTADNPLSRESWILHDLDWLSVCDVLIRLPGVSPGSDVEEERANGLHIPVVHVDPLSPLVPQVEAVLR